MTTMIMMIIIVTMSMVLKHMKMIMMMMMMMMMTMTMLGWATAAAAFAASSQLRCLVQRLMLRAADTGAAFCLISRIQEKAADDAFFAHLRSPPEDSSMQHRPLSLLIRSPVEGSAIAARLQVVAGSCEKR